MFACRTAPQASGRTPQASHHSKPRLSASFTCLRWHLRHRPRTSPDISVHNAGDSPLQRVCNAPDDTLRTSRQCVTHASLLGTVQNDMRQNVSIVRRIESNAQRKTKLAQETTCKEEATRGAAPGLVAGLRVIPRWAGHAVRYRPLQRDGDVAGHQPLPLGLSAFNSTTPARVLVPGYNTII